MRRLTVLLAALAAAAVSANAQEKPRFNPDLSWNAVRAEYGYWTPMDSRMSSGDAFLSLNYTRRYSRHWGWRVGLMYQTENTSVQDGIGLPVAAVLRSGTESWGETMARGAESAASQLVHDAWMDYDVKESFGRGIGVFLLSIFRRAEVFAGVTPGYVFGDGSIGRRLEGYSMDGTRYESDEGILLNQRFMLTADAGFNLSIPIWRFSLDLSPAFHYLVTNNFSEFQQSIDPLTDRPVGAPSEKPVHWYFSISGGISWLF